MMRSALQRCGAPLLRSAPNLARHSLRQSIDSISVNGRNIPSRLSILSSRQIHGTVVRRQEEAAAVAAAYGSETTASKPDKVTRFQELADRQFVHPNIIHTLTKDMKLENMTDVQSETIHQALQGKDIIGQAKTGTGKTLAFLIPVLQNIISKDPHLARLTHGRRGPRSTADDIRALIISPTRELAEQIAHEAKRVVRGTGIIVQTAVGGTQKMAGLRAIQKEGCHVLVGTPGRLQDILTDQYSRVEAPDLSALVFDEADRLLDQGFWPDIQEIMRLLPRLDQKDRQTMMFSATVPKEVVQLVRTTLKPGFDFVQCVSEDDEPTHERVAQHIVVTSGFENNLPALTELITNEIEKSKAPDARPFKAIIYYSSAAELGMTAVALQALKNPTTDGKADVPSLFSRRFANHPFGETEIFEIHSKLTQSQRTAAANAFRRCKSGVLLSTDVTARGLDFPDVTHVIQMGGPQTREQYIHRIGRTARAGKEGQGWLIVNKTEVASARRTVGDLPIKPNKDLETANLDLTTELQVSTKAGNILSMLQQAFRGVNNFDKAKTYKALLGVNAQSTDKRTLVEMLNNLTKYGWGMREPPSISPVLAARLGLSRIPGIRTGHDSEFSQPRERNSFGNDRRSNSFGSGSTRSLFGSDRRSSGRSEYGSGRSEYGSGRSSYGSGYGSGSSSGRSDRNSSF